MVEKANILVVDDEEVVRLSHLRILANACCNAEAAWDGTEALRAMEQHSYDVILLDLRMPGLDGMSVLKTIKERWPETEVVVISRQHFLDTLADCPDLSMAMLQQMNRRLRQSARQMHDIATADAVPCPDTSAITVPRLPSGYVMKS